MLVHRSLWCVGPSAVSPSSCTVRGHEHHDTAKIGRSQSSAACANVRLISTARTDSNNGASATVLLPPAAYSLKPVIVRSAQQAPRCPRLVSIVGTSTMEFQQPSFSSPADRANSPAKTCTRFARMPVKCSGVDRRVHSPQNGLVLPADASFLASLAWQRHLGLKAWKN